MDGGTDAFNSGLGAAYGFAVDIGVGAHLIRLRAGHDAGFGEIGITGSLGIGVFRLCDVTRHGCFGLPQLRAVAGEGGFGLAQGFAVGTGVDLKEQRIFGDVLAFREMDLEYLAGDLRFHLHGFRSVSRADYADFKGDCFPGCRGDSDGNCRRPLTGGDRLGFLLAASERG